MDKRLLFWTLLGLLLALGGAVRCLDRAEEVPVLRAADALPPYLAGAAMLDGTDPTTQEGLQAAYEAREMEVGAATFSNLYPATAGWLMQPLASLDWEDFIKWWRLLLIGGALLLGMGVGGASVRGPRAPLAAALGACMTVWLFPYTGECAGLGQVNLGIAALLGLAMLGICRGREEVAGICAALGACIKLVPGIALVALVAGRSGKAVAWMAGVGLGVLGLTLLSLPLSQVIDGIQGTLAFQSSITPDWMNHGPTPTWMRFLGDLRHTPLALGTLALMGICCWRVEGPDRAPVLAGSIALSTAWLGADAAAFHVLYAPLFLPALVWVGTWFLDPEAPRWSRGLAAAALVPWLLSGIDSEQLGPEALQVVAGMVLWLAVAARLLHQAPLLHGKELGVLGAALGLGLMSAIQLATGPRGPAPHELGPEPLLPEGVGHGGPVPGEDEAQGPSDRLIEEVLPMGQTQKLTSHLVQSPREWAKLDTEEARSLVAAAPSPPAGQLKYGELMQWLIWERQEALELEEDHPVRVRVERLWAVLGAQR